MTRQRLIANVFAAGATALAVVSLGAASTGTRLSSTMTAAIPSSEGLGTVRADVQQWLAASGLSGFRVSEVMAFTNNDYVAVDGKNGKPAFELLVAPNRSWLMEEPASMLWNTRYGMFHGTGGTLQPTPGMSMMWGGGMMRAGAGMMGGPSTWYTSGAGRVTSLAQAATAADTWLANARPGETAETDGRVFPGYFTLDTTRDGKTAGMLSVNASTGAVWYHGWHGTFLGERQFGSGS